MPLSFVISYMFYRGYWQFCEQCLSSLSDIFKARQCMKLCTWFPGIWRSYHCVFENHGFQYYNIIGGIWKYFELTHGVHWKYVHTTPDSSRVLRFHGRLQQISSLIYVPWNTVTGFLWKYFELNSGVQWIIHGNYGPEKYVCVKFLLKLFMKRLA